MGESKSTPDEPTPHDKGRNMDEYCFKTSGFDILCVPLHTRRKKKETQIASPLLYAAETS